MRSITVAALWVTMAGMAAAADNPRGLQALGKKRDELQQRAEAATRDAGSH